MRPSGRAVAATAPSPSPSAKPPGRSRPPGHPRSCSPQPRKPRQSARGPRQHLATARPALAAGWRSVCAAAMCCGPQGEEPKQGRSPGLSRQLAVGGTTSLCCAQSLPIAHLGCDILHRLHSAVNAHTNLPHEFQEPVLCHRGQVEGLRGAAADAAKLQDDGCQEGCGAAQSRLGDGIVVMDFRIAFKGRPRPCRDHHPTQLLPQAVQLLCRAVQRGLGNRCWLFTRSRAHWLHQQALACKHRCHRPSACLVAGCLR